MNKHNYRVGCKRVHSPTYTSWAKLKQRCLNKNDDYYFNYGGRGITVCNRWLCFSNFLSDMGIRPEGKTIDRINTNKGYYKSNCKWSTRKEQQNNTRRCVLITHNGVTKNITQWCTFLGMKKATFFYRRQAGLSYEKILSLPVSLSNRSLH